MYKLETVPARVGKRLFCGCEYSWVYLGTRKYVATCPRCHSSVMIEPKREKKPSKILPELKEQQRQDDRKNEMPLVTPEKVRSHAGLSPKAKARATPLCGKEVG